MTSTRGIKLYISTQGDIPSQNLCMSKMWVYGEHVYNIIMLTCGVVWCRLNHLIPCFQKKSGSISAGMCAFKFVWISAPGTKPPTFQESLSDLEIIC